MAEQAHGAKTQVGLVVVDLQSNLEFKDFVLVEYPTNLHTSINFEVSPYQNILIARLEAVVHIESAQNLEFRTYFKASCHNQVTKFLVVVT